MFFFRTAPKGSVRDVIVSVLSPSSVNVSWLPTNKDNWNGPIQQYTVEYKLLQSADNASAVESSGMGPFYTLGSISIPNNQQELVNNPDPTQATLPLNRESVVVQDLQEHHIYQFTVYYENIKGISKPSVAVTQETSVSGMKLLSNVLGYELINNVRHLYVQLQVVHHLIFVSFQSLSLPS